MPDFLHDIPDNIIEEYKDYYKIAVIGSRKITDKQMIYNNLNYLINTLLKWNKIQLNKLIIVSGKAIGVDRIAMQYAIDNNLIDWNILADWDKYGKRGGMLRNPNIIKHSDRIIAFQLDNSKGTQNGIDHAMKMNKKIHVISI